MKLYISQLLLPRDKGSFNFLTLNVSQADFANNDAHKHTQKEGLEMEQKITALNLD